MRSLLSRAAPWVVLVISLAAGMVGWLNAVRRAEAERRSLFLVEAERIHAEIAYRLEQIEVLLQSTAGLFAASHSVDRSEWRQFTSNVLQHDDAGVIRGLAFIRRVPGAQLDDFLRAANADHAPAFELQPAGDRAEYRIIQFIEPADANHTALGFDSNTVAQSREAMNRAARTGKPAVSAQFHLRQEPSQELSVALYTAVYDRTQGPGPAATPMGWVGASLRTEALAAQVLPAPNQLIGFELFDSSQTTEDHRLRVRRSASAPQLVGRRTIDYPVGFGGRKWLLRVFGEPPASALHGESGLIGCGALVISLLLFGLVATVNSTRARAAAIAETMTADLRTSEARSSRWTEVLLRLTAQQACFEGDLREALGRITEAGAEALAVERVRVWTRADEGGELTCLDQYERTGAVHRHGGAMSVEERSADARALEGGQLVVADRSDSASAGGGNAERTASALVAPVRLGGRTIGVIAHEHVGGPRTWTLQERSFAASLAAQVSLTLETHERRRAEQVLKDYATALERANASLEASSHEVQAANQAKTEFLANMSHEIRTPLTSILGYAELVLHDEQIAGSADEREGALRVIQRNGEHLLGILNDILDLSKIEAGKLSCEQLRFSPGHLLHEVAALMGVRAQAKGLDFNFSCDGPIPQTIRSDPTRLRQILINLLGNAVKFTETGEIKVVVRMAAAPAELIEFEVRDTGIGMNAAQVESVFQPFAQGDTSTTRQFGGTGLGLAISSRLAEMLGGRLECESNSGAGSVFRVFVATGPLQGIKRINYLDDGTSPEPEAASEPPPLAPLARRRVLLAEDGPDNQRLVSLVLRKAGAETTIVENGQEAVDQVLAAWSSGRPFDIVLMDMQMPVLDGYSATEQLRQAGYTLPIVALTAHAMVGDREKCLAAGCSEYSTKPIDRRLLIAQLVELLNAPEFPAEQQAATTE